MSNEKKTVLVVDDDIDFLAQMEINFQGAGYNVVTAEGQVAAEKKLAELKPDIAVVDLMMENPDAGFVLSYHINKVSPKTKVILVTAVTSETGLEFDASTDEERSWVKADAFLAKPIRFEQLLSEINKIN
ncbi:response regulator [bacterium]|nr:response regulator [bacterium]